MSDTENDEAVSNFIAFTGSSDPDVALSYLEMSGGDLETAVGLYLEHNNINNSTSSSLPPSDNVQSSMASAEGGRTRSSGTTANIRDFSHAMAEEDFLPNDDEPDWFASEDMADGPSRTSIPMSSFYNNPNFVRAPDQTQRMRLMDDVAGGPYRHSSQFRTLMGISGGPAAFLGEDPEEAAAATAGITSIWGAGPAAALAAAEAMTSRSAAAMLESLEHGLDGSAGDASMGGAPGVGAVPMDVRAMANAAAAAASAGHHRKDSESSTGEKKGGEGRRSPPGAAPSTLSDMFAPPYYVHRAGGFQGARNVARDARRWLLVNIQSEEDFACHALNRDVWGDELVANLVQEGFIFWQQVSVSVSWLLVCLFACRLLRI